MNSLYVGIYGIFDRDGKVLVIKKARGPYKGKYDLPGGGLESNETVATCLKREILEETGLKVRSSRFFAPSEHVCKYKKDNGECKDFHHLALYYIVDLSSSRLKTDADGEDSLGAEFISIGRLNKSNTSAIALPIIKVYSRFRKGK